jgi:hypothetical protein
MYCIVSGLSGGIVLLMSDYRCGVSVMVVIGLLGDVTVTRLLKKAV